MSLASTSLTAVVIGLDCPTGLQTARELDALGLSTVGVADRRSHPCARTRACRRVVEAGGGANELADALERLAREGKGRDGQEPGRRILVPCTDGSVRALSRLRGELAPENLLVLPEPELLERLLDKARFAELAREEGLPVPPTRALRSRADAEEAAAELEFPCAVKPHRKTAAWREATDAKLFRAEGPEELLALYDRCAPWARPLVAQSWVPGTDSDHYTCNLYFGRSGQPLAVYTSRKLRQWPRTGGQGCLSESRRNEEVEALAVDLFGSLGYRGLAYVETKRDARSGEHRILEVNVGRPTGRSAAAPAAGVPLLETMVRDAAGLELPGERAQGSDGGKWIHLRRDTQAAAAAALRGELGPGEWLRSVRGPRVYALLSWRDPLPFWLDLVEAGLSGARWLVRRASRRTTTARVRRQPNPTPPGDGYLALHASAFLHEGCGAVVAGPAHSGKTGALLAFGARGAGFVADDRVFLRPDGGRMVGARRPLTVRPWHLRQLPEVRGRVPPVRRTLIGALLALEGGVGLADGPAAHGRPRRGLRRIRSGVHRRLSVEMRPEELFGANRCVGEAVPATLFLLEPHRSAAITVEAVARREAAGRLAAHAEADRARLEDALRGMSTHAVRLPNPCSLSDLYAEMQAALAADGVRRAAPAGAGS